MGEGTQLKRDRDALVSLAKLLLPKNLQSQSTNAQLLEDLDFYLDLARESFYKHSRQEAENPIDDEKKKELKKVLGQMKEVRDYLNSGVLGEGVFGYNSIGFRSIETIEKVTSGIEDLVPYIQSAIAPRKRGTKPNWPLRCAMSPLAALYREYYPDRKIWKGGRGINPMVRFIAESLNLALDIEDSEIINETSMMNIDLEELPFSDWH